MGIFCFVIIPYKPIFGGYPEASEYWDNTSIANYSSHVVEFEYAPDDHITIVAIAPDIAQKLEQQAQTNGISVETLVNLWIQEKLTAVFPLIGSAKHGV